MRLKSRVKKVNLCYLRSLNMSNRTAQSGYFQNQGKILTPSISNQSKPVLLSNKVFFHPPIVTVSTIILVDKLQRIEKERKWITRGCSLLYVLTYSEKSRKTLYSNPKNPELEARFLNLKLYLFTLHFLSGLLSSEF
jgi:hypothetical protein